MLQLTVENCCTPKSHDASFCNWCLYPLRHTYILFISTDSSILSGERLLQESHNSYVPVNRTHICPYVPIRIHNDCQWFSFTYHILLLQRGASKRLLLVQLPYKHICCTWILGRRYPIVNRSVLDNPKISRTCDAIHWIGINTAVYIWQLIIRQMLEYVHSHCIKHILGIENAVN